MFKYPLDICISILTASKWTECPLSTPLVLYFYLNTFYLSIYPQTIYLYLRHLWEGVQSCLNKQKVLFHWYLLYLSIYLRTNYLSISTYGIFRKAFNIVPVYRRSCFIDISSIYLSTYELAIYLSPLTASFGRRSILSQCTECPVSLISPLSIYLPMN